MVLSMLIRSNGRDQIGGWDIGQIFRFLISVKQSTLQVGQCQLLAYAFLFFCKTNAMTLLSPVKDVGGEAMPLGYIVGAVRRLPPQIRHSTAAAPPNGGGARPDDLVDAVRSFFRQTPAALRSCPIQPDMTHTCCRRSFQPPTLAIAHSGVLDGTIDLALIQWRRPTCPRSFSGSLSGCPQS
ncbi:hypothetical protein Dsin_020841 [Dipteronia sinensis]|uniref:Uncharacterized protein n=1 Tax=Dipteronia sinensis TaxID=43782 RepID=A0AAE0AA82_9ROSI|nr:hypothetical protein Dsin_020841 [Dipteronia sinensis]